jgi:hypothetical protein
LTTDAAHWFTANTWDTIAFRAQVFGWTITFLGLLCSIGGYWAKTNASFLKEAPRQLLQVEADKLAGFLAGKPFGELLIKANVAAKDARAYADEIASVLNKRANWSVRVDNALMPGNSASGLWVTVKDANAAPIRAVTIHDAFAAAGQPMDPVYRIDAALQPDEVWLSIGFKN